MTFTDDFDIEESSGTFPDKPQPGQNYKGWEWDGERWWCRHPPGPGGPRPPQPDRPLNGPIIGVTNGSVGRRGEVGEYLRGVQTVVVGTQSVYNVTPLVLPPGDWDVVASAHFNFAVTLTSFSLTPLPAGMLDNLFAEGTTETQIIAPRAQAAVKHPTLLAFTVNVEPDTTGTTFVLTVTARRMR
jgi:hypothetical protein